LFSWLVELSTDSVWWGWEWNYGKTIKILKLPENNEIDLESKKSKILEYIENDKLVSLDDNQDLKDNIIKKIENWSLNEKQINTIYNELISIKKIEDKILAPDLLKTIDSDIKNEKIEKQIRKSRKMTKVYLYKHEKEIKEAEDTINFALWFSNYLLKSNEQIMEEVLWEDNIYFKEQWKQFREKLGEETMEDIRNKKETFGFSYEVIKNLTDPEKKILSDVLWKRTILEATPWDIYALKQEWLDLSKLFLRTTSWEYVKWKEIVKEWMEFVIDFYWNEEIDKIVWIGDILDINSVSKLSVNWVEWNRKSNPRPWFYGSRYLAIHDNFNIKVTETKQFIGEEFNKANYNRFLQVRWKEFENLLYSKIGTTSSSLILKLNTESDKKLFKEYIESYKEDLSYDEKTDTLKSNDWKPLKEKSENIRNAMIPKNASELMKIPGFSQKLDDVCFSLWMSKTDLLVVIWAESNFNPKAVNPSSWASGLIQFMVKTAIWLWTTVSAIRQMWAVEQLKFVEKYFKPYSGKLHNVVDVYKAVFFPVSLNYMDKNTLFQSWWITLNKLAIQNPSISRHSTRSDWYIDWYAFEKYVNAHVWTQTILYEDKKNWVSDDISETKENLKDAKSSLILDFVHWDVDSKLSSLDNDKIKRVENIFIFRNTDESKWTTENLSWDEMKKISEKLIVINPELKIFTDQEWWKVTRFNDFDNKNERWTFLKDAVNNSSIEDVNKKDISNILYNLIWDSKYPSLKKLGEKYNSINEKLKDDYLKVVTYLRLDTLQKRWINNYWLVADLNYWNSVIWWLERSFWKDPSSYEKFWKAMIDNAKKLWMTIYLKHFPGHGAWYTDSHKWVLNYWDNEKKYLENNISLFEKLLDYWKWEVWLMVWHMYIPNNFKTRFENAISKSNYVLTDDLWMEWYKMATSIEVDWKFFTTDLLKWSKIIIVDKKNTESVL